MFEADSLIEATIMVNMSKPDLIVYYVLKRTQKQE